MVAAHDADVLISASNTPRAGATSGLSARRTTRAGRTGRKTQLAPTRTGKKRTKPSTQEIPEESPELSGDVLAAQLAAQDATSSHTSSENSGGSNSQVDPSAEKSGGDSEPVVRPTDGRTPLPAAEKPAELAEALIKKSRTIQVRENESKSLVRDTHMREASKSQVQPPKTDMALEDQLSSHEDFEQFLNFFIHLWSKLNGTVWCSGVKAYALRQIKPNNQACNTINSALAVLNRKYDNQCYFDDIDHFRLWTFDHIFSNRLPSDVVEQYLVRLRIGKASSVPTFLRL